MRKIFFYISILIFSSNLCFSQKIIKQIGGRYYDCLGYETSPPNMKTFDIRWDSTDLPNPNIGEHLPPSKRIWNTLIEYYYCDCEGSDKGLPPKLSSREYYKNGKLIYTKYYKNRSSLKSVRIKKSKLLHKLREE